MQRCSMAGSGLPHRLCAGHCGLGRGRGRIGLRHDSFRLPVFPHVSAPGPLTPCSCRARFRRIIEVPAGPSSHTAHPHPFRSQTLRAALSHLDFRRGLLKMNPGEIYRPPSAQQQQAGPQGPRSPASYTSPNRTTFPQSTTYPNMPNPAHNPYSDQQGVGQIHHSQSQPFPPYANAPAQPPPGGGYADPFNDQHGQPVYNEPPGSRHYPSHPNLGTPQMGGTGTPAPYMDNRNSMPPSQSFSPPPRTRFDSNPSFQPAPSYNSFDQRLSSPPPLLPTHSSNSSIPGYPPRPNVAPQGGFYGTADDDLTDSAPLLNHATPDARFGIPQSASAMSMRPPPSRYQLSDSGTVPQLPGQGPPDGDMGVVPGGWDQGFNGPGDEDDVNVHYGPVPTRVVRRNRTQKRVA